MAHRITPRMMVQTSQGEVQVAITIDLNVNITTDGQITAQAVATPQQKPPAEVVHYEIPDFISGIQLAEFGKEIGKDEENGD